MAAHQVCLQEHPWQSFPLGRMDDCMRFLQHVRRGHPAWEMYLAIFDPKISRRPTDLIGQISRSAHRKLKVLPVSGPQVRRPSRSPLWGPYGGENSPIQQRFKSSSLGRRAVRGNRSVSTPTPHFSLSSGTFEACWRAHFSSSELITISPAVRVTRARSTATQCKLRKSFGLLQCIPWQKYVIGTVVPTIRTIVDATAVLVTIASSSRRFTHSSIARLAFARLTRLGVRARPGNTSAVKCDGVPAAGQNIVAKRSPRRNDLGEEGVNRHPDGT